MQSFQAYRPLVLGGLVALGCAGLSACNGGSSSSLPSSNGTAPPAILAVGTTQTYVGTMTEGVTYTAPSATLVNSNSTYTYTEAVSVKQSAGGAPAPFDINRVYTYTATQPPVSGTLQQTQTTDTFENQVTSGSTLTLQNFGSTSTTVGQDLNAALRLGGGPFTITAASTTTYTTPQTVGVYPLQAGATYSQPVARVVTANTTDTSGATIGGGGQTTTTYANDGSYTRTMLAAATGNTTTSSMNTNGSGQSTQTGGGATVSSTTISPPVSGGSGLVIPVQTTNASGTVSSLSATDWYPNGGNVPVPLQTSTTTVRGVVSLPSQCNYSGTPPAVTELDATTFDISTIGGNYATGTSQRYDYNGVTVCRLATTTTYNFAVNTGALTSTTTTTTTETLTSAP